MKFARKFKITATDVDKASDTRTLDNIDSNDFNDKVPEFLKEMEQSIIDRIPREKQPNINIEIYETITLGEKPVKTDIKMSLNTDNRISLHDLQRYGLDWFREKAEINAFDDAFDPQIENGYMVNPSFENGESLYAILGYDHGGLQRGDIVKMTIQKNGCSIDCVDTSDISYTGTLLEAKNHEKYVPFKVA